MKDLEQHLLSSKQSKVLAETYDRTNYAEINKNRSPEKPDSKMYTVELSILKEYLKLIEDEMDKHGIKEKGVRVTLGKYPDKSGDPKLDPKYLGYQTIFFSAVDLDNHAEKNTENTADKDAGSTEDIPDMNYMHITPPW